MVRMKRNNYKSRARKCSEPLLSLSDTTHLPVSHDLRRSPCIPLLGVLFSVFFFTTSFLQGDISTESPPPEDDSEGKGGKGPLPERIILVKGLFVSVPAVLCYE